MTNIFTKLLTDENHYTDLLCNLLALPEVHDAFVSSLNLGDISLNPFLFKTRSVTETSGNPDILYEDDAITLLVEVKTDLNRGLTGHQPSSYLRYASQSSSKRKVVVFLIPVDYRHKINLRKQYLSVANKFSNVEFRIAYWSDLSVRLEPFRDNIVIGSFVECLHALTCRRRIAMNSDELANLENKSIIVFYLKLRDIVNGTADELKKDDHIVAFESDDNSFGYMIYDSKQRPLFWFGIWHELWQEDGYALAVVCNKVHKNIDKFRDGSPFQNGEYVYSPLRDVRDGDKVVEEFVALIRKYL